MKITIFGLAWSGTSTIWKLLSEKSDYKFMSSWNIMRSWADKLWYSIYDFEENIIKNDDSFDIKLDNKVADYWNKNDDFVFESRLAWNFIPDSFKIYLKCDDIERYNRINTREWLSIEEITKKTKKREKELIERYAKFYPDIVFPPQENKFDLVIDSTNLMPEKVLEKILDKIK